MKCKKCGNHTLSQQFWIACIKTGDTREWCEPCWRLEEHDYF